MKYEHKQGEVFWQPESCWKPEHHIPFEGHITKYRYTENADWLDTVTERLYTTASPALIVPQFEVQILNPSSNKVEIDAGDTGIIVGVDSSGYSYHIKAICEQISGNHLLSASGWQDAYVVNYDFKVYSIQIGSTILYVLRVDMGDGTYAELLMTEKEREMFDPKSYRERRLVKG